MAEGEFALVRQHLEAAMRKPVSLKSATCADHDLYAMLADAAAQQRDAAALRQYAPLAEETARRFGHKLYQAIAHRAWGVAHRLAGRSAYAEAEARLNQALALFHELDTRWQVGRTLFELGELAQAQQNIAGARDHFAHALAAFEELQANPDAARTRAAMETLGRSLAIRSSV
jgi:tetratricopeptide (TPR) repeat protein